MNGNFFGSVKLEVAADSPQILCTFDATCDCVGLGEVLGVAARNHLQLIPEQHRGEEFKAMLAAFVVSAADRAGVLYLGGSAEIVTPHGEGSNHEH